jgi:hypothetical protein
LQGAVASLILRGKEPGRLGCGLPRRLIDELRPMVENLK